MIMFNSPLVKEFEGNETMKILLSWNSYMIDLAIGATFNLDKKVSC